MEDLSVEDLSVYEEIGQTCALFNLRKAARAVSRFYEEALGDTGLHNAQFSLLVGVRLMEPVTISSLADCMVMDRSTLTRNLNPLVRGGLLDIRVGEDKRVRQVCLTPLGKETLGAAVPAWRGAQQRVVKEFGQEEFPDLLRSLSALAQTNLV